MNFPRGISVQNVTTLASIYIRIELLTPKKRADLLFGEVALAFYCFLFLCIPFTLLICEPSPSFPPPTSLLILRPLRLRSLASAPPAAGNVRLYLIRLSSLSDPRYDPFFLSLP